MNTPPFPCNSLQIFVRETSALEQCRCRFHDILFDKDKKKDRYSKRKLWCLFQRIVFSFCFRCKQNLYNYVYNYIPPVACAAGDMVIVRVSLPFVRLRLFQENISVIIGNIDFSFLWWIQVASALEKHSEQNLSSYLFTELSSFKKTVWSISLKQCETLKKLDPDLKYSCSYVDALRTNAGEFNLLVNDSNELHKKTVTRPRLFSL